MTTMHEPITREQKINGMANQVAFDCRNNIERRHRIDGIRRKQGADMAEAVRQAAWRAMQSGVRNRVIETPAARSTDPDTSHAAADHVTENGSRDRQRRITAATVAMHPGSTARELAMHCELDRYDIGRRLSECETAGDVRRGDARRCSQTGRQAIQWYPAGGNTDGR